jgi:hypothetical protein
VTDTAADGHPGHVPSVERQRELRCRCFGGAGPGTIRQRHTPAWDCWLYAVAFVMYTVSMARSAVALYAVQVIWSDANPMMWKGKYDSKSSDWADPNERGWAKPPAFLPDAPPYGKLRMLWAPHLTEIFDAGCKPNNTRAADGDGEVEHHPWAWLRDQVRGGVEQPRRDASAAIT